MNMIRVGEIHGPCLLVRSRVGVYIYVTCCCVGSAQFFICLEFEVALISLFWSACLRFRAKPHKFSHLIFFLAHKVCLKLDLGRDRGIDMAEEGPTLEYTPTWVVAVVIVAISLAVERVLHYTGNVCHYLNLTLFFFATIISISLV